MHPVFLGRVSTGPWTSEILAIATPSTNGASSKVAQGFARPLTQPSAATKGVRDASGWGVGRGAAEGCGCDATVLRETLAVGPAEPALGG